MRRLRTTMSGVVALVLLVSMAQATTAQDAEQRPPAGSDKALLPYAGISGHFLPDGQVGSFDIISNPEPPKELWRGWAWSGRIVTNDPRLTCDAVINQNADHFEPGWSGGAVRTGISRCENEGGHWTVESVGFTKPDVSITVGNYYAQVWTGHGGYEGLSAVLIWMPSGYHAWDIEGVIAPGPLPEPPTSVEAPTG